MNAVLFSVSSTCLSGFFSFLFFSFSIGLIFPFLFFFCFFILHFNSNEKSPQGLILELWKTYALTKLPHSEPNRTLHSEGLWVQIHTGVNKDGGGHWERKSTWEGLKPFSSYTPLQIVPQWDITIPPKNGIISSSHHCCHVAMLQFLGTALW